MSQTLQLNAERLRWTAVDDEVVIVDTQSSVYLAANASGAVLWERLTAGTTREDLVAALVDAFGLDRDRAETDVDVFLAALRRHDCLIAS
jgi:hypothetical protein